ncbi:MAG: glycosyltransferase family 1 protein [archaeon]
MRKNKKASTALVVDFIDGIITEKPFGVRVYQEKIHERLPQVHRNIIRYKASKNVFIHLLQRLFVYPAKIIFKMKKNRITYITMPDLAYLLHVFRFKKCIVGCYDLTSLRRIRDYHWITRIGIRSNYDAIKKYATRIITHSAYSKNDIHKKLGIPLDNIDIIHPMVDHELFSPKRNKTYLKKYGLTPADSVVLYVGSEEPRQNVDKVLRAIALVRKKLPRVQLLKIGNAHWEGAREKHQKIIKELGLQNNVVWGGPADPIKELPKIYNAVDVLVYPCSYSGWGLPPLEAMACGTPTIISNRTSLPEVGGDAAIQVKPTDEKQIAKTIIAVLTNDKKRKDMSRKGLQHAAKFTWDNAAKQTLTVYRIT